MSREQHVGKKHRRAMLFSTWPIPSTHYPCSRPMFASRVHGLCSRLTFLILVNTA